MNYFFSFEAAQKKTAFDARAKGTLRMLCLTGSLALMVLNAGCNSVERSRDLSDQNVPSHVMAQQVCASCHGMNGTATSPIFPNLAGQQKEYLVGQLKSYRSHNRSDPAGFEYMWGLSAHLTDDQINGLADYFSLKQPLQGQATDTTRFNKGKNIYENGISASNTPACTGCHGAVAQGNGQFPRLAGQHADYLIKQLEVFQRSDQRPEGAVMKTIAHGLTSENIKDVSFYLQGMQL